MLFFFWQCFAMFACTVNRSFGHLIPPDFLHLMSTGVMSLDLLSCQDHRVTHTLQPLVEGDSGV